MENLHRPWKICRLFLISLIMKADFRLQFLILIFILISSTSNHYLNWSRKIIVLIKKIIKSMCKKKCCFCKNNKNKLLKFLKNIFSSKLVRIPRMKKYILQRNFLKKLTITVMMRIRRKILIQKIKSIKTAEKVVVIH